MIPIGYLASNFLTSVSAAQRAALYRYGIRQVGQVDPADEPISLEDAQRHLDVDTYDSPPASDFDAWITAHIPAAREYCEQYAGLAFAQRTMELATNAFPSYAVSSPPGAGFVLPFGPVQSIASVVYLDEAASTAAYTAAYDAEFLSSSDVDAATAAGEAAAALALQQTVDPATYSLDVYARPSRLILAYGQSWPTSRNSEASIRVRYVTGYTHPDDSPPIESLPSMARAAILEMLRHLFDHPGDEDVEIPRGVKALLDLLPGGRERLGMA